mgnify:CR=1 FL=1
MTELPVTDAYRQQIDKRRTFAIISHPDAGKTTLTEKLLLYGGAIRQAGSVKARKAERHATSDWMDIEKQRGISVTSLSSSCTCPSRLQITRNSDSVVSGKRFVTWSTP